MGQSKNTINKFNYPNQYLPVCDSCTEPNFDDAVDKNLVFCAATKGRNILFLAAKAKMSDLDGKTPSRCPRLRKDCIGLDKEIRGSIAIGEIILGSTVCA